MKKSKNTSGFNTPEEYFERLEERLFVRISIDELPINHGHKVPDSYFESFEERMMQAIRDLEKPKAAIPLFSKKYLGYAAAIAAILVIGFAIFKPKQPIANLDFVQLAAIDSYIEEGNLNFDLYELTTFIGDDDLIDFTMDGQFSEASLENYIFENLDEEILINE